MLRMKDLTTSKGTIHVRRLLTAKPGKSEVRREIVRLLEEKTGIDAVKIAYTTTGKPFIAGHPQWHISISHAANLIAVYISEKKAVGIDIEQENTMILKARSHFINPREASDFPTLGLRQLHLIWGAKEAIFKHYEGKFTELENEVTIRKIGDNVISVISAYGEDQCFYEILEDVYLVWV